MAKINLKQYGITGTTEVIYNPSYDELYREETRKGLRGYEKGQVTEMGAVNVMTGVYTGRSPKDKFFVMDETTKDTIWWTSPEYKNDNKPVTKKTWKELKKIAVEELSNKKLFVVDTFCGANENTRLKIRFIMEVAWQAHFVKNMFIRPTDEEPAAAAPDAEPAPQEPADAQPAAEPAAPAADEAEPADAAEDEAAEDSSEDFWAKDESQLKLDPPPADMKPEEPDYDAFQGVKFSE